MTEITPYACHKRNRRPGVYRHLTALSRGVQLELPYRKEQERQHVFSLKPNKY